MGKDRLPRVRAGRYPLDVFRVEEGTEHFIRSLEQSYGGLFTHFYKGRSRYCPGDRCDCQHHRLDRVWKGYTSVEVWDQGAQHWAPAILEISEALEVCFRGKWGRGQVWKVSRRKRDAQKDSYPVQGEHVEDLKDELLPDPFPYKPVLMRLYHQPDGIETVHRNPMPMPQMVEPSRGRAPTGPARPAEAAPSRSEDVRRILEEGRKRMALPSENGHGTKGGQS